MHTLTLKRLPEYFLATPGVLYHGEDVIAYTIELPWRDNLPNISCIPVGWYQLDWTFSPRFKRFTVEVMKVPNRTGIRFHPANEVTEIEGCIAPVTELRLHHNRLWGMESIIATDRVEVLVRRGRVDALVIL